MRLLMGTIDKKILPILRHRVTADRTVGISCRNYSKSRILPAVKRQKLPWFDSACRIDGNANFKFYRHSAAVITVRGLSSKKPPSDRDPPR